MSAHLLHIFSTFVAGGPQVRTAQLIGALGADFRHSIVAMDGREDARSLLPPEVDCHVLPAPERGGSLRTVRRIRRLLGEVQPDLVLTYNWGAIEALMAARLGGRHGTLHHEDGFRPDELGGFKKRRIWARRLVLRGRDVIVPSNTLFRIATELWQLDAQRVHWIPNSVRVENFQPADGNASRRERLGIPRDAIVIGSVGHLRGEKNPVRLIEAVAAVECARALHVLMLGDGAERGNVEAAVERLGLRSRVHLVGHRENPAEDYRTMDLFALSSDTEQMPFALLEAMASGLAVVSTDVGDVRDMLPAEQREFCCQLDAPSLARAISRLLESDHKKLGRANRARAAERFSFERMVAAYRERLEAELAARA